MSFLRLRHLPVGLVAASTLLGGSAVDGAVEEADEVPEEAFSEVVVVTATRSERALDQLPVSVTVVGREELERTPALVLDDALRGVAGLNLPLGSSTTQHPTTHVLSMRGLGGSRALVLVDGCATTPPPAGR